MEGCGEKIADGYDSKFEREKNKEKDHHVSIITYHRQIDQITAWLLTQCGMAGRNMPTSGTGAAASSCLYAALLKHRVW